MVCVLMQVKSYDELVPIHNVARVAIKDAQTLVVTAFDANVRAASDGTHSTYYTLCLCVRWGGWVGARWPSVGAGVLCVLR